MNLNDFIFEVILGLNSLLENLNIELQNKILHRS